VSEFPDSPEGDVREQDEKQGLTASHAVSDPGEALICHAVPVDDHDGVGVALFLHLAADA
jgi:hypothetical protein